MSAAVTKWVDDRCGKTVTGKAEHCASCHQTFTTTKAGDAHQPAAENWRCLTPDEMRNHPTRPMHQDSRGYWRMTPKKPRTWPARAQSAGAREDSSPLEPSGCVVGSLSGSYDDDGPLCGAEDERTDTAPCDLPRGHTGDHIGWTDEGVATWTTEART